MKLIPNSVTRSIGRKVLQAKKNSPHIFFAAGIVGVVGSTVMACRATLNLEKTVDDIKTDLYVAKELKLRAQSDDPKYNEQEYYRDLGFIYAKSAVTMGKLYGPSVIVGAASIAALTGSHIQLTRRNSALTFTLAAVSKAYEEYRVRIREEIGEKRELEIYHDIHDETVDVDGKKKKVAVSGPNGHSPYRQIFDESNTNWQKNAEMNRIFIECQQTYANHVLNSRGHIFLNEVYDQLGFDHTPAGQIVGWLRDGDGDKHVDFGLYEPESENFVLGFERNIWLDFNVDGVVYDKI